MMGLDKVISIGNWYEVGLLRVELEIGIRRESMMMMSLIVWITSIVIIYSYWYMGSDSGVNRFIGYLWIFSVAMLILVLANNIFLSFLGWESVGIMSFLLINFWSNRSPENSKSALKAIIFNRVGDIFYILALLMLGYSNTNMDYTYSSITNYISLSLLVAAMAKSAQIILHPWLGDAMAGPTPVSALLHAATMVTAGVYLILRYRDIFILSDSYINELILIVGSLTILFAGLSAINQYDLKKIIAFSTCGQIGYMFFALALPLPSLGSLFHLLTHGAFKALLFLSAGILIHSFLSEQDLRKYGNSIFSFPLTFLLLLSGSLAIVAFPGLSGYISKELILISSLELPFFYYLILIFGSFLSTLYSFKLLYLTFFSSSTSSSLYSYSPIYSNFFYLLPLLILFLGSIFLGYFLSPIFSSIEDISPHLESFIAHSNSPLYLLIKSSPILFPILAILYLTYSHFYPSLPWNLSRFLYIPTSSKLFFDNIFHYLLLIPSFSLSYQFSYKFLDRGFLEFLGPLNLFRLFFFSSSLLPLSKQSIFNLPFLFFFLSISLSLLSIPFLL